jgi:hypothetical protein
MADIKLGYGCGIKATLLMPTGVVCDLRDALLVNAVLVLPNGSTMYAKDISADNVTNAIYVRLLADRELTTEGNYSILFNVKLVDGVMYSTVAVNFANVTTNADAEYKEIVLSSNLEVTDYPHNVQRTGASPKVSPRQTWLVYNDEAKAYEDTGIPAEVNFSDYYTKEEADAKVAELDSKGSCYWAKDRALAINNRAKAFVSVFVTKIIDCTDIAFYAIQKSENNVVFNYQCKRWNGYNILEVTGSVTSNISDGDYTYISTVSKGLQFDIVVYNKDLQTRTNDGDILFLADDCIV